MPQALLVNLPDKTVTTTYNKPHSGASEWWGGSADGLNNSLTRDVDLTGKTGGSLTFWLQGRTEALHETYEPSLRIRGTTRPPRG